MAAGDYAAACPKFEESYRLDPANGTLFGLAICHENEGRWATATTELTTVAAAAAHDGRSERAAVARKHIALLEPKVSKLAIELSPDAREIPALEFACDGVRIDAVAGGGEVPIDPGSHILQVSATGRASWTTTVSVGTRGERIRVLVPALASVGAATAPPRPMPEIPARTPSVEPAPAAPRGVEPIEAPARIARAPEAPPASSPRRVLTPVGIAGIVVGGAGVVTALVGAWEGFHAIDENNQARSRCPSSPCADLGGVALSHGAVNDAVVSDVLFGVGAAAIAVGVYLVVRGVAYPVAVTVGPRSAALRVEW